MVAAGKLIKPAGAKPPLRMRAWHHQTMSQTYGMEKPKAHVAWAGRAPVRYVVVIDAAGAAVSRLFLASRHQVDEYDGGVPEVAQMIQGVQPVKGADGPEWDAALQGHSMQERLAADVYTLEV